MAKQKGEKTPNEEQNGGEQLQKKERKPRATKDEPGSPKHLLHEFVSGLNSNEAEYLRKFALPKTFAADHADPTGFEGTIYTGIKNKLA